jgi:hypothetical protein
MSFYTYFDWFKKLRLFVNVRNLKIKSFSRRRVPLSSGCFSLNEAPLGLFKFISDYLPYFEKINIFFNIIAKQFHNSIRIKCTCERSISHFQVLSDSEFIQEI